MTSRIVGIGITAFGLIVTSGFVGGTIETADSPVIAAIAFLGLLAVMFTGLSYIMDRVEKSSKVSEYVFGENDD